MAEVKQIKWSITTVNTLRRCGRQFFFHYVAAYHSAKDSLRKRAYELKKMKSLLMWKGSLVETGIEKFVLDRISAGQEINRQDVIDQTMDLARRQFRFSEQGKYRTTKSSDGDEEHCILDIYEIPKAYSNEELDGIYADIERSINNFFEMQLPEYDMSILEFLKKASWLRPNVRNYQFLFENIKVNPQIDLLLYYENKPVVIDWKVSNNLSANNSRQLSICGITVKSVSESRGSGKIRYSDIGLYEVNLLNPQVKKHTIDQDKVNEIVDYIYATSGDIGLYKGGKPFNEIDINEFPITDKDGTCNMCNYQTLCKQVLEQNNVINYEPLLKLF